MKDATAVFLERLVDWVETAVAAVLAFIIVLAVGVVVYKTFSLVADFPAPEESLSAVIKAVLDVFIVVELFRITVAYVRHSEVIPTVLETALVVAAREVVVIEAGKKDPVVGMTVAAILVAIGITWWLLRSAARADRVAMAETSPPTE